MAEYMHLVGAEDVSRAASTMRSAAETMSSAASSIDFANQQQRQFMDDWLQRFEQVLAEHRA
jgi:hypothetical protein